MTVTRGCHEQSSHAIGSGALPPLPCSTLICIIPCLSLGNDNWFIAPVRDPVGFPAYDDIDPEIETAWIIGWTVGDVMPRIWRVRRLAGCQPHRGDKNFGSGRQIGGLIWL